MKSQKTSTCTKVMSFIGIIFLLAPLQLITARPYRYYHTKSQQPVRQNVKPRYTQGQIDNAWIKVPWSHGGHYWHNTLTRDDQDNTPSCLLK